MILTGEREAHIESERQRYGEIERHSDRETKRLRDRADNKNPEQSRVARLVLNNTLMA